VETIDAPFSMSKREALNQLFEEWKALFEIPATDFYADGVINESLYESCLTGLKILVIAKEPNASNHDQNGDRSFVTEWDNKKAKYPFARRIGEWAFRQVWQITNNRFLPPFGEKCRGSGILTIAKCSQICRLRKSWNMMDFSFELLT
jgi:hypothetical protein